MKRFVAAIIIAAAAALPASWAQAQAALSLADRQALAEVEAYLNSIQTMRTDFRQIGSQGGRATGKIYLQRPGRMRVQFDPPAQLVMVATPVWLIIDDGRSNEPTYIPVRASPAYILTREQISLNDDRIQVTNLTRTDGQILVRISDSSDEEQGSIIMIFHRNEGLELTGWTVIDGEGRATQVQFMNMETGVELDEDLFLYSNPRDPQRSIGFER